MAFTALLDACTLHPAYLRDTLLCLAEAETFRPLWSQEILDEVKRSLTRRGFEAERVDYMLQEMVGAFEDATIQGYEHLIPAMTNDVKDRHVLAAAVVGGADLIVTANTKDFPVESVATYCIEVISPDEFLLNQLDLFPGPMMDVLIRQASGHQRPPRTVPDLLARLRRDGLSRFPDAARDQLHD